MHLVTFHCTIILKTYYKTTNMRNNLHLWLGVAACCSLLIWGLGRQHKINLLESKTVPSMPLAWYEFGKKVAINPAADLPKKLVIQSFKNYDTKGFISEKEWNARLEARVKKTYEDFFLSSLYTQEAERYKEKFETTGRISWMINNSEDPIFLQRCFFPLMIREAKDLNGKWRPVEYLTLGFQDYYFKEFSIYPGEALPFHYKPFTGSFKTKIRFKILGTDCFYYSKPFTGYIEYGAFKKAENEMSQYHYKMDQFRVFDVPRGSCSGFEE